ncbi:MAG: hypothetical protein QW757_02290 [Candidatus Woesearchaeota archaeon]
MGSFASEKETFFYNLKRYGLSLSKEEIKQSLITISLIAFMWSFDKWGTNAFDVVEGLKNFLIAFLFTGIALFFFQIGQRIFAVYYGYDPVYESCMTGLMIGMIITFASRGKILFFLPGGINIRHLRASRLGEFRYYTNQWEWAKIGFLGPFLNVFFAVILSFFKQYDLVRELIFINIMFAWLSLIPAPGNSGMYLFYPHIYFWVFIIGFVFASSLLLLAVMFFDFNPLLIIVIGMIFGFYLMFTYYKKDGKW